MKLTKHTLSILFIAAYLATTVTVVVLANRKKPAVKQVETIYRYNDWAV